MSTADFLLTGGKTVFDVATLTKDVVAVGRGTLGFVGGGPVSSLEILNYCARIVRVGIKLNNLARASDDAAMAEILDLARQRAPVRTGTLQQGIEGYVENTGSGRQVVISATAHGRRGGGEGADYAPFVEFGTAARAARRAGPLIADDEYFRASTSRAVSGHQGTEAQPFFWNSAREVLSRRNESITQAIDGIAAEEGFSNG